MIVRNEQITQYRYKIVTLCIFQKVVNMNKDNFPSRVITPITVNINHIKITVLPIISIYDLADIINADLSQDCKQLIAAILKRHIIGCFENVEIGDISKDCKALEKFVNKVIDNDVVVKEKFLLKRKTESVFHSFVNSYKDYFGYTGCIDAVQTDLDSNISAPGSREMLNNYIKNASAWGELGWSPFPSVGVRFICQIPEEADIADKKMTELCDQVIMEELFQKLLNQPGVEKDDCIEAIENFRDQRYKSCSLLLCSLLDSKLIHNNYELNIIKETYKRKNVGGTAIKELKNNVENKQCNFNWLVLIYIANLFSCLGKIFSRANDFKEQPRVINRNFLLHGMLEREVTHKDCLQLFSLYFNYLQYQTLRCIGLNPKYYADNLMELELKWQLDKLYSA